MDSSRNLLHTLIRCDIFKVGNFKLKTGFYSPIYVDLRRIINFPTVIKDLANAIRARQIEKQIKADVVCGVPYTALPVASLFSVLYDVPMVIKRKEAKDYGTKKILEGNILDGDSCLIIEDIVTSGSSVIETAEVLRNQGLKVEECIVVVDRNQGATENLKKAGIKLYPLFSIDNVFEAYCSINHVEEDLIMQVKSYFKDNHYLPVVKETKSTLHYSERANTSIHPIAKKLFALIEQKKTNLCVAVDTNSSEELIKLANHLGPHICILKTHIDILNDFSHDLIAKLKELSRLHNFLIMEDRKFADIGNTVKHQFMDGLYRIQSWADMVTVHAIPGNGIIDALKNEKCALILIAEMSSKGALTTDEYKERVLEIAENNADYVVGYVAQKSYPKGNLIHMCPGINISSSGDSLGQQYKTPEVAVSNGADIVIVGRGICKADNIEEMAMQYKNRSFDAYMKRVSN